MVACNLTIKGVQTKHTAKELNGIKQYLQNINQTVFNHVSKHVKFINNKHNYFVFLLLTNNTNMVKYNYQLQGIKKATNVLSLQLYNQQSLRSKQLPANVYLGDIYICLNTTMLESKQYNVSFNNHLARLYIHGLLHLMGFVHNTNASAKKMYAIENTLLQTCVNNNLTGLVGNYWQN